MTLRVSLLSQYRGRRDGAVPESLRTGKYEKSVKIEKVTFEHQVASNQSS
jgi:hypothetical protein